MCGNMAVNSKNYGLNIWRFHDLNKRKLPYCFGHKAVKAAASQKEGSRFESQSDQRCMRPKCVACSLLLCVVCLGKQSGDSKLPHLCHTQLSKANTSKTAKKNPHTAQLLSLLAVNSESLTKG